MKPATTTMDEPSFSIGVEEEYLLVDRDTRNLASRASESVIADCKARLGGRVSTEFLQCQVEVATEVCDSLTDIRRELAELRSCVARVAASHDLAALAASSHPFAQSEHQPVVPGERYWDVAEDLQAVARRLVIGGMHVHVGVEDRDLRIDLMRQCRYVVPHLLALSTSSPFWEGSDTGLKSYRIVILDQMPRVGLPPAFENWSDYSRHVDVLVDAGVIEDTTRIWWDVRPNARFPTIELRVADVCTRIDDAVCIAALFRCWLHMIWRLRQSNQRWRAYRTFLLNENRWRAQRYGLDGDLIDFGRGTLVPFADLVRELLELIEEDAEHFGCTSEVEHAMAIVDGGTSAHRQLARYEGAIKDGASHQEALVAVVDLLLAETLQEVAPAPRPAVD